MSLLKKLKSSGELQSKSICKPINIEHLQNHQRRKKETKKERKKEKKKGDLNNSQKYIFKQLQKKQNKIY